MADCTLSWLGSAKGLHLSCIVPSNTFLRRLRRLSSFYFVPLRKLNACHIITRVTTSVLSMDWPRAFVSSLNFSCLLRSYKISVITSHPQGRVLNPCRCSTLLARSTTYVTTGTHKCRLRGTIRSAPACKSGAPPRSQVKHTHVMLYSEPGWRCNNSLCR
jgi:hypothetical protein